MVPVPAAARSSAAARRVSAPSSSVSSPAQAPESAPASTSSPAAVRRRALPRASEVDAQACIEIASQLIVEDGIVAEGARLRHQRQIGRFPVERVIDAAVHFYGFVEAVAHLQVGVPLGARIVGRAQLTALREIEVLTGEEALVDAHGPAVVLPGRTQVELQLRVTEFAGFAVRLSLAFLREEIQFIQPGAGQPEVHDAGYRRAAAALPEVASLEVDARRLEGGDVDELAGYRLDIAV